MLEAIQNLDQAVLLWIQEAVRLEALNPLVELYTTLGNGGALCGAWPGAGRRARSTHQ